MKTNFKINLGEIRIEGREIKDVNIEAGFEYSVNEVRECYKLFRQAVKDMPEIMEDAKNAFYKFSDIENEVEEKNNLRDFIKERAQEAIKNKINNNSEVVTFSKGTNIRDIEKFLKFNGKIMFGEEVYIDSSMHYICSKENNKCLAHIEITD